MGKFIDRLKTRIGNALLTGGGAGSLQDKGSLQTFDRQTLSPYYNNNFLARWQDYTRLYETEWVVRKGIEIPVQDALRLPVKLEGIDPDVAVDVMGEYSRLKMDNILYRALIQERLLGGCIVLGIFKEQEGTEQSEPYHLRDIEQGDVLAANLIDVTRIALPETSNDPFSPDYDNISSYLISGVEVHKSRMCILEGSRLYNNATRQQLQGYRYSPAGFGESIIAKIYDLLIRVTGSQEAAYHLISMASCLIVSVDKLRMLEASGSPAADKIAQVVEQLSIYRGAVVDGEGVNFKQHNSSFGSVPELMSTFMNFVAAAFDIPLTRFMGVSPGGLNATGESDLESYYSMIGAWQIQHVKLVQKKLIDWAACNLYGWENWIRIGEELEILYEPLWTESALERMQTETGYMTAYSNLAAGGIITPDSVIQELEARSILKTKVKEGEKPEPYKGEF
jgi:phage-related protein (TIGR01555 family)